MISNPQQIPFDILSYIGSVFDAVVLLAFKVIAGLFFLKIAILHLSGHVK